MKSGSLDINVISPEATLIWKSMDFITNIALTPSISLLPGSSCWRHGMGWRSAFLALCEGNPSVTSGFPSQRTSDAELWCALCCYRLLNKQWSVGDLRCSCDLIVILVTKISWSIYSTSQSHAHGSVFSCFVAVLYRYRTCWPINVRVTWRALRGNHPEPMKWPWWIW